MSKMETCLMLNSLYACMCSPKTRAYAILYCSILLPISWGYSLQHDHINQSFLSCVAICHSHRFSSLCTSVNSVRDLDEFVTSLLKQIYKLVIALYNPHTKHKPSHIYRWYLKSTAASPVCTFLVSSSPFAILSLTLLQCLR
jgi:hypothetical protein